jgi:hypothetical protein
MSVASKGHGDLLFGHVISDLAWHSVRNRWQYNVRTPEEIRVSLVITVYLVVLFSIDMCGTATSL